MATQTSGGTNAILVADDNASLRAIIVEFLAKDGIRAVEASDGEMAVRQAKRLAPPVVLLDIKMPKMDGLAAGRIMADMPSQPKIILMSGFDESVRLANRADLPVFAVLEKPLQLRTLSKFIRAALGNTTYQRYF